MNFAHPRKQARRELRRARAALIDVDAFLDDAARARLQKVLSESDALRTVYEARQRFTEIWQIASASNERLVHALQEWCREAENSGVEALEDFARLSNAGERLTLVDPAGNTAAMSNCINARRTKSLLVLPATMLGPVPQLDVVNSS